MGPLEQEVLNLMNAPLAKQAAFWDATASLREDPGLIPINEVALGAWSAAGGIRAAVIVLAQAVDALRGEGRL